MNNIINGRFVIVSRKFAKFSAMHFITFFQNVINGVTAAVAFAGIKPTPAEAQASLDVLADKDLDALNGGGIEIVARDLAQIETVDIAREWASQVDVMCAGNLETLLSSNFEARRAPTASEVPGIPTEVRTTYHRKTNVVMLRAKRDPNAANYSSQYAESADGPWIDMPLSTKANIAFPGLTPAKMYWFRLRANGAKGSSLWTAPTCKITIDQPVA
jgi:hypothetical protein